MTFWQEPLPVETFSSAAIALARLEVLKLQENQSRLRLHKMEWTESFGELLFSTEGLTVEVALGYVSFSQLCSILGLGCEEDFLRGLRPEAVRSILQQYTETLQPYEVKLVIHRREKAMMLGSIGRYHVVKRMWPARGNHLLGQEQWLYGLMLLEQAGWELARQLVLEDDLLVAVLYHPQWTLPFKGAETTYYRGLLLAQSEAGRFSRSLPALVVPEEWWLPLGDAHLAEALELDWTDLLAGRVGLWGVMPHYKEVDLRDVTLRLSAQANVSLADTAAVGLLMKGGYGRNRSISLVGGLVHPEQPLTGYSVIRNAIQVELRDLEDDPLRVVQRVIKLGLVLWD